MALRNGLNLYLGVVIDPEDINNRYIGEGWFRLKIWFHKMALSNRYEQTEDALSGTLSLDHNPSSDYDYPLVNSTDSVFVSVGDSYDIKTNQDSLQFNGDYLFHNNWDHLPQDYFLERNNYIMDSRYTMNGYFDNKYVLSFSHPEIKIQDPWFVRENGTQTGTDWIVTNGNYKVFLNQNENFNNTDPIYRIKILSKYYTTQSDLYVFYRWTAHNGLDYGGGVNQPSYDRITDVVFKSANANIVAEYRSVSDSPNYTLTIEENETLTIPSGADITFADNFTIFVDGGIVDIQEAKLTGSVDNNGIPTATLDINRHSFADIDNSTLKNFALGLGRDRFFTYQLNNHINLNYSEFENVYVQIYGYAPNYPNEVNLLDMINCTWVNSYISSFLEGNYTYPLEWPMNLANNIFSNTELNLHLDEFIEIINNHNLYFNSIFNFDNNNTCIVDLDPNFVDLQNGNYNLAYGSPAIDAGDPSVPNDPDGTVSDMGAYYFHQSPSAPTHFRIRGRPGQNPRLTYRHSEPDVNTFEILRSWDGGPFHLLAVVNETQYIDTEVIIAHNWSMTDEVCYKVNAVDDAGFTSENSAGPECELAEILKKEMNLPKEFALHNAYPNPFNPVTTIKYDIPEQSQVQLIIFDLLGRKINTLKNKTEEAGWYSIKWDGTNKNGKPLSSGMYIIHITALSMESDDTFTKSQKVVLLK